jgi:hypothetical protein
MLDSGPTNEQMLMELIAAGLQAGAWYPAKAKGKWTVTSFEPSEATGNWMVQLRFEYDNVSPYICQINLNTAYQTFIVHKQYKLEAPNVAS